MGVSAPTRAEQQFWGLRYIDDAVMRRRLPIASGELASGSLDWAASPRQAGNAGKPSTMGLLFTLLAAQRHAVLGYFPRTLCEAMNTNS